MPIAGDWHVPQVTVDPYDGTTVAVLHVIRGDGTSFDPVLTSDDGGHTWKGPEFEYTMPGEWWLTTAVTGTGARTVTLPQVVMPQPGPFVGRTYATSAELAALEGIVPEGAGRALARATTEVDQALWTAVYDVDDEEMPTDPVYRQAVREATCAQVAWWDELGTADQDAAAMFQSVSIAGVSLGRAAKVPASGNPSHPTLCRKAWTILSNAGLLGHPVWTY